MKKKIFGKLIVLLLISCSVFAEKYAKLVNPQIGILRDGNMHCGFTYVGACRTFGMVQFGPQTGFYN